MLHPFALLGPPGHVLISPIRVARRFSDLTPEEVSDVMLLAQRVGARLERHYGAAAMTLAVQDGEAAGQTVGGAGGWGLGWVGRGMQGCSGSRPGDFQRVSRWVD